MSPVLTESLVEDAVLAWLEGLGYAVLHGPAIAPGELAAERTGYGQVVLEERLRQALWRLNPELPAAALDDAFRKLTRADAPSLVERNRGAPRDTLLPKLVSSELCAEAAERIVRRCV